MNRIVKRARKTPKKSPAIPRTAEMASGTEADTRCAPSCTFSAAPESPIPESSSEFLSCSTVVGRSWRKSRTPPTSGTRRMRKSTNAATAVPRTVIVAASPRDRCVLLITNLSGYSNTSPRKMPTKTIRNVSPIARNAATSATVATMRITVRIGMNRSTRRRGFCSMARESTTGVGRDGPASGQGADVRQHLRPVDIAQVPVHALHRLVPLLRPRDELAHPGAGRPLQLRSLERMRDPAPAPVAPDDGEPVLRDAVAARVLHQPGVADHL